jgi:phosphonate transport system permease protein
MKLGLFLIFTIYACYHLGVDPIHIAQGLPRLVWITSQLFPPETEGYFLTFLRSTGESFAMALTATLSSALLAIPLGLLGAHRILPAWFLRWPLRRSLDLVRSIDSLLWALLFVNAVGMGPFSGVLALIMINIGSLSKLLSEDVDHAARGPIEGVQSLGANAVETIRFGIIPQILPVYLSQVLYYLESNMRHATILGIVGAGGIGMHLADRLRVNEWRQVSAILLLILAAVTLIDLLSRWIRASVEKGPTLQTP